MFTREFPGLISTVRFLPDKGPPRKFTGLRVEVGTEGVKLALHSPESGFGRHHDNRTMTLAMSRDEAVALARYILDGGVAPH